MIECEKCHAQAMSCVKVTLQGKQPGKFYEYNRYVHYRKVDRRKKNQPRRSYCYVRAS